MCYQIEIPESYATQNEGLSFLGQASRLRAFFLLWQARRLPYFLFGYLFPKGILSPLLAAMVGLPILPVLGQEPSSEREKPVKAHVKIFNACLRSEVDQWGTGLDLEFRNQPLAMDVRVGEGGQVRTIEFTSKDTVDVRRHAGYLRIKGQTSSKPSASLTTSFPEGSVTLLVVHGVLEPNNERLQIDAIREFPLPDEVKRPGLARFVVWNFRPGNPVMLAIGNLAAFELPYRTSQEFYLNPQETEIFLIYKNPGQLDLRRQLAAFRFVGGRNYTGIISPASEVPDRPLLRISDSNEQWEAIIAPPPEEKSE